MLGMTYASESRLIRSIFVFIGLLLTFHFLYSMKERVTYLRTQSSVPQPTIPSYLQETLSIPPVPRKIWQTGKNGAASLSDESRAAIKTWQKLNQNHRYEILTDTSAETYVRTTFADTRPEIVDLYLDIADPILRADFLRYLVLLGDGGVYSDMDTECLKPIDDWIPASLRGNVSVVVGVEYDRRDGGRWGDWTLDLQLTNWAMLARPGHPMIDRTVRLLRDRIYAIAEKKGSTLRTMELEALEVLDTTGPAMFTNAIFGHISEVTGTNFTWTNLTGITSPKLVNDILILPVTGFAPSQDHSGSLKAEEEFALVRHLFKGSWKGDRPADRKKEEEKKQEEEEEERRKADEVQALAEKEQAEREATAKQEEEKKAEEERKKKEDDDRQRAENLKKELQQQVEKTQKDQDQEKEKKKMDELRHTAEQAEVDAKEKKNEDGEGDEKHRVAGTNVILDNDK